MSIFDFSPKGGVWTGVTIGVGLMVAPAVIPIIATVARPVAKGLMKTGLMLYEKGSETVAELVEGAEDLAAEAKSELHAELKAAKR